MEANRDLAFYEGAVAAIKELFAVGALPTQHARNLAASIVDECGMEIQKKRTALDGLVERFGEAVAPR